MIVHNSLTQNQNKLNFWIDINASYAIDSNRCHRKMVLESGKIKCNKSVKIECFMQSCKPSLKHFYFIGHAAKCHMKWFKITWKILTGKQD